MRMHRVALAVAAAAALGGVAVADDEGAPRVGVAVGYSSQFERPVVAVDFLVTVDRSFAIVPNASFVDGGSVNRWTAGVELQWNAPAYKLHERLLAWAGAGISVLTEDPDGPLDPTTRDLVPNLVFGVGYDAPAAPFVQMRVGLADPTDFAFSVGVRF